MVSVNDGDFADPPGDPSTVEDAATRLADVASGVDGLAGSVPGCVPTGDAWSGQTADAARTSAQGVATALRSEAAALLPASPALREWASSLREAKATMSKLRLELQQEMDRHSARLRAIATEASLRPALVPAGPVAPPFGPDPSIAEDLEHAAAVADLRRRADQVRDDLDADALTCRRALENTCSQLVRGHRESLTDYLQGAAGELLEQIPVLRKHSETVDAALWAFMTAPQALVVGTQAPKRAIALMNYWKNKDAIFATKYSLLQRQALTRMGWASHMDDASALSRFWLGASREANLLSTFSTAVRGGSGWSGLATGVSTTGKAAGLSRVLGVGGAGAATLLSAANVAAQGNPIDAWKANGTEYAADVAELGFNASLTTFMVAPNPWSAGAVAITGVAWAGLEIYNHREDIANLAKGAVPLITDTYDAVATKVDDTVDAGKRVVTEAASNAVDDAKKVASALNPFD